MDSFRVKRPIETLKFISTFKRFRRGLELEKILAALSDTSFIANLIEAGDEYLKSIEGYTGLCRLLSLPNDLLLLILKYSWSSVMHINLVLVCRRFRDFILTSSFLSRCRVVYIPGIRPLILLDKDFEKSAHYVEALHRTAYYLEGTFKLREVKLIFPRIHSPFSLYLLPNQV